MPQETYHSWLDYYRQKGVSGQDINTLSGYDHPLARLTPRGLEQLTSQISDLLKLNPKDRLLDVGCGAGLITTKLTGMAQDVTGVDANHQMIKHATGLIKKVVGTADAFPFKNGTFDKILCHSVFQYFPNLEYAQKALKEFMRVLSSPGILLIMDLPDTAKREDYLRVKGPDSHNLTRIFYSKSWFL